MNFDIYCRNAIKKEGGLDRFILSSTDILLDYRKDVNPSFMKLPHKDLKIGAFFLIKYYYNGNNIWCPIFTIEFRTAKNKNILYAINLDYLPYNYKMQFFNLISKTFVKVFDANKDIDSVKKEYPLNVNFELIYRALQKTGGYNYSITAYDVTKIREIYKVSTNLLYRFIFLSTKEINRKTMKSFLDKLMNSVEKDNLKKLLEEYDELLASYTEDTKEFYKRLKMLESHLKLFED